MKFEMSKNWRKCEKIMTEFRPAPSKAKYVRNVQRQIERNPAVFPTEAQEDILNKIYRTLERENLSEVEKQARESLGLPV